jgi:hypothetical protein
MEVPAYPKPARYSIFWFQNYFSEHPATVFKEDEVFYDRSGYARSRSERQYQYWNTTDSCIACHGPYNYCYWGTCHYGSCDCGEAGGIIAIIVLVLVAIAAFFIACAIAFYYPPVMIISWLILVIGSFTQSIVGFAPECFAIRWYNGVCSIFVALVTIFIVASVIRLQRHYRYYYPGTPNVQVDVEGLKTLFRTSRIFYCYFCIPSACLLIAGLYLSLSCGASNTFALTRKCQNLDSCAWTSYTMYCWIVIHALNAIAALAMYKRMQAKYLLLKNPPSYEESSSQAVVVPAPIAMEVTHTLPVYQALPSEMTQTPPPK